MNKLLPGILFFFNCWLLPPQICAQNYLENKLSIEITNQRTEVIMLTLEQLGGFNFSYNSQLVDPAKIISLKKRQENLHKILDQLFNNELTYKVIGSHIILQSINPEKDKSNTIWILSGIITDSKGHPLENAIVYEINRQTSFITAYDGKYALKLKGNQSIGVNYSCKGYQDTIAYIHPRNKHQLNVSLQKQINTTQIQRSNVVPINSKSINWTYTNKELKDIGVVHLMVPKEALYVSNNLNVSETKFAQISFVPFWGTNYLTSGLVTNKLSLNILAGYAANVKGVELGGLANIIRQNMNGVQVSGLINMIGKDVNGLQIAGVINTNLGNMHGIQISGTINKVKGKIDGMQVSGLMNIAAAKSLDSLKTSGWNGQFSGGFNLHGGDQTNLQISGLYNQANSCSGLQVTGGINIVKGTTNGLQLSSIFNHTDKLRGVQIALINHADTIENGFPIGLVNIIKNGYQKLEFSTDESFYFNAAYKTGGKALYSFLRLGVGKYLNAAYGIGITSNTKHRLSANLDLSGSALFNTDSEYDVFAGDLYRAQLGLNYKVSKHITLTTGPSYNFCSPNKEQSNINNPSISAKNSIYFGNYYLDKAINTRKSQFWFGWQMGLRF